MSLYECVFIARQDLSAEDVDKLSEKLGKIITEKGGKVASKQYWGLRNLAYEIKKNGRGHYVLLNIEAETPALNELKRVVGFNEDIIRSNIFKVEEFAKVSHLAVSVDAKSAKSGKKIEFKPDEIDLKLEKLVINS